MAITTQQPPPGPTLAPPIEKRGPGRPPKPPSAEKPAVAGEQVVSDNTESFLEWIDSTTDDEWNYLICYAHRTHPVLELSGVNKTTNIEKIGRKFDLTYILKTYGSGGYRFDVSRIAKDGNPQKRIRQGYVVILNQEYPPRIPIGSWMDDPRNKDWEWCKPALLAQAASLMPVEQPPSAGETMNEFLDMQIKMKELNGGDANASLLPIILQALDPAKQIALIKQLTDMGGGNAKPATDPMMVMFIQMMMDDRKAAREEAKELRAQQTAAVDPLASFKSFAAVLQDFGVNIGGVGAKSNPGDTIASTIGDIVSKVVDKAADIAPMAIQAFTQAKAMDLQKAQLENQRPAVPQAQPWALPSPGAPQVAAAPASPGPQLVQPPADQPMTAQLLFYKYREVLQRVSPFLLDHFRNSNGDEFREWFIEREGLNIWSAFRAEATPEFLTQGAMMLDPKTFSPQEDVAEFFDDMLNGPFEDDDPKAPIVEEPTDAA